MMSGCEHKSFVENNYWRGVEEMPDATRFCRRCPQLQKTLFPVQGDLVVHTGELVDSDMAYPATCANGEPGLRIVPCKVMDTPDGWIEHRAQAYRLLWGTEPDMGKLFDEQFSPPESVTMDTCGLGFWNPPTMLSRSEAREVSGF